MEETKKENKYSQIVIPEGLQYAGIPKMLAYKESNFSYVQITFILYLLSQPATSNGRPWLYRDEDIFSDTGISRKSIGRFKDGAEKESLAHVIKFIPAHKGKYKTGGFYVDFTNLWRHLTKVVSLYKTTHMRTTKTNSPEVDTASPEIGTPSPESWTESRTSYTTSYTTSNTTSYDQEEDFESEELIQDESKENTNVHKNIVTPGAIDEEFDELDAQLEAAGIICRAPSIKDQAIEQRIIEYFKTRFPADQGRDYSLAFVKAKIPSNKLEQFWKYKENWNTYPALKGTDRSLYMLVKYIDDFIIKNMQAEHRKIEQEKIDDKYQELFSKKMKLIRQYKVWLPYEEGFDSEWNKMKKEVRQNAGLYPRWISAWIGNPTELSEEQIISGKYTKENILKTIRECDVQVQEKKEIIPDEEFERTLMESLID